MRYTEFVYIGFLKTNKKFYAKILLEIFEFIFFFFTENVIIVVVTRGYKLLYKLLYTCVCVCVRTLIERLLFQLT